MVYVPSWVPFPTVDRGAGDAVAGDAVTGDAVEDGDVGVAEDPALAADEAAPVLGATAADSLDEAVEQPAASPAAVKATVRVANRASLPGIKSARRLRSLCLDGCLKDLFIFPP
jgi:hypothetical protein